MWGRWRVSYGHHYRYDPFYYHGGYVRDRVHYVSEEDVRALEKLDSVTMPDSFHSGPDIGMGDMIDFGGFD